MASRPSSKAISRPEAASEVSFTYFAVLNAPQQHCSSARNSAEPFIHDSGLGVAAEFSQLHFLSFVEGLPELACMGGKIWLS